MPDVNRVGVTQWWRCWGIAARACRIRLRLYDTACLAHGLKVGHQKAQQCGLLGQGVSTSCRDLLLKHNRLVARRCSASARVALYVVLLLFCACGLTLSLARVCVCEGHEYTTHMGTLSITLRVLTQDCHSGVVAAPLNHRAPSAGLRGHGGVRPALACIALH